MSADDMAAYLCSTRSGIYARALPTNILLGPMSVYAYAYTTPIYILIWQSPTNQPTNQPARHRVLDLRPGRFKEGQPTDFPEAHETGRTRAGPTNQPASTPRGLGDVRPQAYTIQPRAINVK
eukprot:3836935-Pyramimonas_sp.AAC.2